MNDETTNLDQADEDILTYTASDEALEAAASTEREVPSLLPSTMWNTGTPCSC
jgi:hypothetical protein